MKSERLPGDDVVSPDFRGLVVPERLFWHRVMIYPHDGPLGLPIRISYV